MARGLIVVLGAGASFDCVGEGIPKDGRFKPPLVTELFSSREVFYRMRENYPFVASVASEISNALSSSISVETFIRNRYRDSEVVDDKKRFLEIPLYLQHLLYDVSKNYTLQPSNYHCLVNQVLRLGKVAFVTLNYDLILDNYLFEHFPLKSLDSYISPSKNWLLLKLHGSINWGIPVLNSPISIRDDRAFRDSFSEIYSNLQFDKTEINLRSTESMATLRCNATPGLLYYPAVSVPVGSEDELICPKSHLDTFGDFLTDLDVLDLLVIGYSGNDNEVLKLLEASGKKLNSISVVSGTEAGAKRALSQFQKYFHFQPNEDMVYGNTFSEFVSSGKLERLVSMYQTLWKTSG